MEIVFFIYLTLHFSHTVFCTSEQDVQPEINDQFQTTARENTIEELITTDKVNVVNDLTEKNSTEIALGGKNILKTICQIITIPLKKIISTPEIHNVLRNMGTCVVNGVMEIISFYFPAPFMPLIASAAGMVIPFEPVITLRRRMPVNSYRRAFKTAVDGFLNTFDSYKVDRFEDDPYMTRRFNRRFMNNVSRETKEVT